MKLHILSDLHLETGGFTFPPTDADLLLLAGNIAPGPNGLAWLRARGLDRPVVYVPGLLEFSPNGLGALDALVEALAPNHLLLHDDQLVIDGVRFIGGLVWTEGLALAEPEACFSARPAGRVPFNPRLLRSDLGIATPADSRALHRRSRERLRSLLAVPFRGPTVLVTAHGLSSANLRPLYAGHLFTRYFVRDFQPLLAEYRIDLWLHGQMAEGFDFMLRGCRMVSNPRGNLPRGAMAGFNPERVVEV